MSVNFSYAIIALLPCRQTFWDRIIAGKSGRRGNLNFTCCGAMRQPQYRLQIVFLSSRETQQLRYKNNYKMFCIAVVVYTGQWEWLGNRGAQDGFDPKINLQLILLFCYFCIAAVVFPGFREKNEAPPNTPDYMVPNFFALNWCKKVGRWRTEKTDGSKNVSLSSNFKKLTSWVDIIKVESWVFFIKETISNEALDLLPNILIVIF